MGAVIAATREDELIHDVLKTLNAASVQQMPAAMVMTFFLRVEGLAFIG